MYVVVRTTACLLHAVSLRPSTCGPLKYLLGAGTWDPHPSKIKIYFEKHQLSVTVQSSVVFCQQVDVASKMASDLYFINVTNCLDK